MVYEREVGANVDEICEGEKNVVVTVIFALLKNSAVPVAGVAALDAVTGRYTTAV